MNDIHIFMTESDGEYLQRVRYFNKQGIMRTVDFSKHKIDCNNINYESLKKQLEVIEFNLMHNIEI